jgi:hypothetical protein
MSQIFHPAANTFAKATIFGGVFFLAALIAIAYGIVRSPYATRANVIVEQPVPFSHEHHVSGLGIDCRYCHASVETSANAGIPPTATCMTCHSVIFNQSPVLAPVRDSFQTNTPIQWNRVYNLPDFVYFDHSIHVDKGVGCVTCHGRVDKMPLMSKAVSLQMGWCLDCHRDPAQYLRLVDQVFNMDWQPPNGDQRALGAQLVQAYHILSVKQMTDCATCHR